MKFQLQVEHPQGFSERLAPTFKPVHKQKRYQRFPLLIVGTTDFHKNFRPIAIAICVNYSPKYILADAADSMTYAFKSVFGNDFKRTMCWAHDNRAMNRELTI
ncbi:hypothetical protein BpHYR1_034816 [Brachionus plicatilis]|uniref:MULE transposase domain-containing protein n=1 Tax=Brachionus plicatilis TaxID=10195 RepID=A0A3M7S8C8_BRAPC|nr:hypothetical protein BpHYR1_034816 [Brachionus plicatilis]